MKFASYVASLDIQSGLAEYALALTDLGITLEDVAVGAGPGGWHLDAASVLAPDASAGVSAGDPLFDGVDRLATFLGLGVADPALRADRALSVIDARRADLLEVAQFLTLEDPQAHDRLKFEAAVALALDKGDPRVLGSAGDDVIMGSATGEEISGGHGNDVIMAGQSHDRVMTGGGQDLVLAGSGRDEIRANGGTNIVDGGNGTDRLEFDGRIEAYDIDLFRFAFDADGDGSITGGEHHEIARVALKGTNNQVWAIDVEEFLFLGVSRHMIEDPGGGMRMVREDAEDVATGFDDLHAAAADAGAAGSPLIAEGLDVAAAELTVWQSA